MIISHTPTDKRYHPQKFKFLKILAILSLLILILILSYFSIPSIIHLCCIAGECVAILYPFFYKLNIKTVHFYIRVSKFFLTLQIINAGALTVAQ